MDCFDLESRARETEEADEDCAKSVSHSISRSISAAFHDTGMHEATANMVLRICLAFQGQCVQSPKILLVGGCKNVAGKPRQKWQATTGTNLKRTCTSIISGPRKTRMTRQHTVPVSVRWFSPSVTASEMA